MLSSDFIQDDLNDHNSLIEQYGQQGPAETGMKDCTELLIFDRSRSGVVERLLREQDRHNVEDLIRAGVKDREPGRQLKPYRAVEALSHLVFQHNW
jgi:hypothetical protein